MALSEGNVRIFISYRRSGETGFAGRIYDHFALRYGESNVFLDHSNIRSGQHFELTIGSELERTTVVIAIIDLDWIGRQFLRPPRIRSETDWVRRELEHALANRTPIIPVLVGNAPLPRPKDIPLSLRGLLTVQVSRVRDESWKSDIAQLANSVENLSSGQSDDELRKFEWRSPPVGPERNPISAKAILLAVSLLLFASIASVVLFDFEKTVVEDFKPDDPNTWPMPRTAESSSPLASAALQLALLEVRLATAEGNGQNDGYNVAKFYERFGLGSIPWSGAFVSWCYLEALRRLTNSQGATLPFTDSPSNNEIASSLKANGHLKDTTDATSAKPGDIVFYRRGPVGFGHSEIVYGIHNGSLCSIGGNVGNQVKGRCVSLDRAGISAIGTVF